MHDSWYFHTGIETYTGRKAWCWSRQLSSTLDIFSWVIKPSSEEILINEVTICLSSQPDPSSPSARNYLLDNYILPAPGDAAPTKGLTTRRLYWLLFHFLDLILNCISTGPEHSQPHEGCSLVLVNKSNQQAILLSWLKNDILDIKKSVWGFVLCNNRKKRLYQFLHTVNSIKDYFHCKHWKTNLDQQCNAVSPHQDSIERHVMIIYTDHFTISFKV